MAESEIPLCFCGEQANLKVSWSEINPGRKFYRCRKNGRNAPECGFFMWLDPELDNHRRESINKILRKISNGEVVAEDAGKRRWLMWLIIGVIFGFILAKM